jgi:phage protein D
MYDSYAPSFKVEIEGEELLQGATVDVSSVSVTETSDGIDTFKFSLRDRHKEAGRFPADVELKWIDSEILQEGKSVKIEIGYVGNRRLMIAGRISAVTLSFPQSGVPTVQIQGKTEHDKLIRGRRRESFTKVKDSDIAKKIADQAGLKCEADSTSFEYPYYNPNNQTLQRILKERGDRIGYEVIVKIDTLYFKKPGYRADPSPVLALEWGRDLWTFQPKLNTRGILTEVMVRGSQTSQGGNKQPIVGTASAGDERVKLGDKAASEYVSENKCVHEEHSLLNQEEAKEIALAKLEQSSMEYITGRGSCMGRTDLEPRKVVEIKNVGKRFSGKYYVVSVTHTIDGGGYRSDFEVKRNAR